MNALTRKISDYLCIDLDRAWRVQEEMMASGISFGNSTLAELHRAMDAAYDEVLVTEIVDGACRE